MTTGARTTWLISIVWSLCIAGSVEGATGTRSELPHAGQIAITLSTSRAQVSVGSGFGVAADVENVSDKTVYFNCGYFVMTPPLEIDPDGPYAWWAYMQGNQNNKTFYTDAIALEPGDKTVAFWAGNKRADLADPKDSNWETQIGRSFQDFIHIVNFSPGDYTIKVTVLYWPDKDSADHHTINYRSQTAEIKVSVASPQWVIILGATIGGIIAYFLFPTIRLKANKIDPLGLTSAALLSVIMTILLARISDTQFFVKITVNDFWGAIAVGFIAVASGSSLLQRYVSSWGAPAPGAPAPAAPAPGAPTPAAPAPGTPAPAAGVVAPPATTIGEGEDPRT